MKVAQSVIEAALAQEAARNAKPTARIDGFPDFRAPPVAKRHPGPESDFQDATESYLRSIGYYPRSPHYLESDSPHGVGFYAHIHDAQQNPIFLDIVLWHFATGLSCEIELKVAGGRVRPCQYTIASAPWACIVWSWDQFMDAVRCFNAHVAQHQ